MANLSLTQVNLKIQMARRQIALATAAEGKIERQASMESALFLLLNAYQHYLRELAENYHLKNIKDIQSSDQLLAAFQIANKVPAELNELLVLANDKTSWLAQMQSAYASLWSMPLNPVRGYDEVVREADSQLIQLMPVSADLASASLQIANVEQWVDAFVDTVKRQRLTSAEF